MTAVVWEIAAILDERRVSADIPGAVWLDVSAHRLRGPTSRHDNAWLRECLRRLTGLEIAGEYRGAPWGAVLLAEWHLKRGEETARLLIPPAAVRALRSPETFVKVEAVAVHHLPGPGQRLYLLLADKKRLRQSHWTFEVEELREELGYETRYRSWRKFRERVLLPAVEAINRFGTVTVRMKTIRYGRAIGAVRFDWKWKSLDEIRVTEEESKRSHPYAPPPPPAPDAPPLLQETQGMRRENAAAWWEQLPSADRDDLRQRLAPLEEPITGVGGRILTQERPEWRVQLLAWEEAHPSEPPFEDLPDD